VGTRSNWLGQATWPTITGNVGFERDFVSRDFIRCVPARLTVIRAVWKAVSPQGADRRIGSLGTIFIITGVLYLPQTRLAFCPGFGQKLEKPTREQAPKTLSITKRPMAMNFI